MVKKIQSLFIALLGVINIYTPYVFITAIDIIETMIVYTDSAKDWIENTEQFTCESLLSNYPDHIKSLTGIHHPCELNETLGRSADHIANLMEVLIEETNQVLLSSGVVNVKFKLVESYHVEFYVEGYTSSKPPKHAEPVIELLGRGLHIPHELISIRNKKDGVDSNHQILNQIHLRRFEVGADIVVFLVAPNINEDDEALGLDFSVPGLASEIGVSDGNNAFAALAVHVASGPHFVFAHEVFHLMGGNHAKISQLFLFGPTDTISARPYTLSDGTIDNWAYNNEAGNYSTLLGDEGRILPILSTINPTVSADLEFGTRERNNAKSVGLHASLVSNFSDNLQDEQSHDTLHESREESTAYGIDFGFDSAFGYDIRPSDGVFLIQLFDFTTQDENCDISSGTACDRYWNNVVSTSESYLTLRNEKGELDQESPIQFSIKNEFYSTVKAANAMALLMSYGLDEMPTMTMTDGMTAIKSNDISSPGANPTIELTNLDACKTYSFQFFCSYGPLYDIIFGVIDLTQRRAMFTTYGYNVKEAYLDCHGNYNRFATIKGVRPSNEGSLTITLMAVDPTPNGKLVSLNGMKFHAEQDSICTGSAIPSSYPSSTPSSSPITSTSTFPSTSPSIRPDTSTSELPSSSPSSEFVDTFSETPSIKPSYIPDISKLPSSFPSSTPTSSPITSTSTLPSTSPSIRPEISISELPSSSPSTRSVDTFSVTPSTSPISFRPDISTLELPSSTPSFGFVDSSSVTPSISPSFTPEISTSVLPSTSPTPQSLGNLDGLICFLQLVIDLLEN